LARRLSSRGDVIALTRWAISGGKHRNRSSSCSRRSSCLASCFTLASRFSAHYAFTGSEAYWLLNPLTLSDSNAARLDANTTIPLDTGVAYKGYVDYAHLSNDCVHTASNSCGTVDYAVRMYAIPEVKKMIEAAVPRTGREFDLQTQLPPGDNWLTLRVVPRALSPASHDWFLRIQLLQVYSNDAEHILRSADWSSTIDPEAKLGEPVKRQLVLPIRTVPG
jgi:hypothetical protein